MTDSGAAAPPAAPAQAATPARGAQRDAKDAVTGSFISLQRTVRQAKARLQAAAGNDVESATHLLLHTVQADGPLRASALAASVSADLSTVSRQVNLLIGRGLIERRADQLDGRASLLALTEAGRAAVAEHEKGRQAFFDEVLAGWSTAELRQFAQQLERFTTAYDEVHSAVVRMREGSPA